MWQHYNSEKIHGEMKMLSQYGVSCLRVFPNWRDFQPVEKIYAWRGKFGDYAEMGTLDDIDASGVSEKQLENFRDFAAAAYEYGISLVVSIVTGWMSDRLFVPPAIAGKNPIDDAEALMWMQKYIHAFVKGVKNCPNIVMWDLGNECNCLGNCSSRAAAYHWASTVADAIRSEDNTRPVSSGMHALDAASDGIWTIADQGEITDFLTPHPYPSPTVGGDAEPYNRMKPTIIPTAQSMYYSGLSGKPAIIQESGTFSQTIGTREMSAEFMRINILSSLVNNVCGYLWWCAWYQSHLMKPPYSWSMIERELGLFDAQRKSKPIAIEMKKMSEVLKKLPDPFPKKRTRAVCVLSRDQNQQQVATAAFILGKQAGLDIEFRYCYQKDIPDAVCYLLPAISGWQVTYRRTWDFLRKKVYEDGAALYISYNGGQLTEFSETVGANSLGVLKSGQMHKAISKSFNVPYNGTDLLLEATSAEVLAKNENGNPVILRNRLGKGQIFFVGFSPEINGWGRADGFINHDYYGIYALVEKELPREIAYCRTPEIGLTVNPENDGNCLVSMVNYSDKPVKCELKLDDAYRIKEVLYGNNDLINACDGCIVRVSKINNR